MSFGQTVSNYVPSNSDSRVKSNSGLVTVINQSFTYDLGAALGSDGKPLINPRPSFSFFSANPDYAGTSPSFEMNRDGSVSLYQNVWGARPNAKTSAATFASGLCSKLITFEQNVRVTIGNTRPGNYINNASESANYKLSVDGKIVCKNWVVTQTAWADSIFTEKHQLPTLDSVETYINTHHHLPGVKSETQVKEMGIDGADMLKDQMAKIEELYLYTIQLKKDLDTEKKKNEALAAKIEQYLQKK